jgi:hypothetical protein
MSKKLNFAPDVVDSTADGSETLAAQVTKTNENTTLSILKNIIDRFGKDF